MFSERRRARALLDITEAPTLSLVKPLEPQQPKVSIL